MRNIKKYLYYLDVHLQNPLNKIARIFPRFDIQVLGLRVLVGYIV
jgi:hypothetical protein